MDSAGFHAETFVSAEEFLASPCLAQTTCLVLDVSLPGMDGLALQQRLAEAGSTVPIIFISAHADESMRTRALQAGAAAFFVKPPRNEALLAAIEKARSRSP